MGIDKTKRHNILSSEDGVFNTLSGALIDIRNPNPESIINSDIAAGLAKICRFNGQISSHYSVAQHSLLVKWLAPSHLGLASLLHDAQEGLGLGDVISPLKKLLGSVYYDLESNFQRVIFDKFGVPISHLDELKEFDTAALLIEWDYFFAEKKDKNKLELFQEFSRFYNPLRGVIWDYRIAESSYHAALNMYSI